MYKQCKALGAKLHPETQEHTLSHAKTCRAGGFCEFLSDTGKSILSDVTLFAEDTNSIPTDLKANRSNPSQCNNANNTTWWSNSHPNEVKRVETAKVAKYNS